MSLNNKQMHMRNLNIDNPYYWDLVLIFKMNIKNYKKKSKKNIQKKKVQKNKNLINNLNKNKMRKKNKSNKKIKILKKKQTNQ